MLMPPPLLPGRPPGSEGRVRTGLESRINGGPSCTPAPAFVPAPAAAAAAPAAELEGRGRVGVLPRRTGVPLPDDGRLLRGGTGITLYVPPEGIAGTIPVPWIPAEGGRSADAGCCCGSSGGRGGVGESVDWCGRGVEAYCGRQPAAADIACPTADPFEVPKEDEDSDPLAPTATPCPPCPCPCPCCPCPCFPCPCVEAGLAPAAGAKPWAKPRPCDEGREGVTSQPNPNLGVTGTAAANDARCACSCCTAPPPPLPLPLAAPAECARPSRPAPVPTPGAAALDCCWCCRCKWWWWWWWWWCSC